jgi:uncharacterized membrane protein
MNSSTHRIALRTHPAHPPFTAFPIAAYVFAAAFDIVSVIGGRQHHWAGQLWHAGTFVLIGGLAICLITMGTGFWDLVRFAPRQLPALQTMATHVGVMAAAFMIGVGDVAWRLSDYDTRAATPLAVVALSLVAAITACTGAFFGGKLVFSHGVGVTPDALAASTQLPRDQAAADHEQSTGARAAPSAARPQSPGTEPMR